MYPPTHSLLLSEVDSRLVDILQKAGLERYISVFQREEINLEAFLLLNNDDLVHMSIPTGPRKLILSQIQEYNNTLYQQQQ